MTQGLMIFACVSYQTSTCEISMSIFPLINVPRQGLPILREPGPGFWEKGQPPLRHATKTVLNADSTRSVSLFTVVL